MRQLIPPVGRLFGVASLFAGLTALGLYVIYDQLATRTVVFDSRLLQWPVLVAAGTLLLVYFAADGLRLYFTLQALGQRVSIRALMPLVFINLFVSHITPLATGGGVAQIGYLKHQGIRLGTATAATSLRTMLAIFVIFIFAPISMLVLDPLQRVPLSDQVTYGIVGLAFLYLSFCVLLLTRSRWLIGPASRVLKWLRHWHLISDSRYQRWRFRCHREILHLAHAFERYRRGRPRDLVLSIVFTLIFLLALFSFPALLIVALGYELQYLITLGLMSITTFIMYFSPTPGAAGIAEGAFGHFFSGKVAAEHLLLVTVAWRFLTVYLGMLIGLFVTFRFFKRRPPEK